MSSDGQELDGFSSKASDSTFDRYSQIVANKTSRYTFYHPITVGMMLANEPQHFDKVLELSEELGYFFQAQVSVYICQQHEKGPVLGRLVRFP